MKWFLSPRLTAGLAAALIWALAAGSALFWALRAGGERAPVDVQVAGGPAGAVAPDARAVGRVLGVPGSEAAVAAPGVASRLALRGIVTHGNGGAALIAVDGKPPRPVRVGAALEGVDGGWTLQSVTPRAALLTAGGQQARLEMPPLSKRSTTGDAVAPIPTAQAGPSGIGMMRAPAQPPPP